MNSLNSFSRKPLAKSWFSVEAKKVVVTATQTENNSQTTSSQSSTISWQNVTDYVRVKIGEEEEMKRIEKEMELKKNPFKMKQKEKKEKSGKKDAGKAMKIRLYPTRSQNDTLKRWFGTCRWTYNRCLDAIEKKKSKRNKKELRSKYINNTNYVEQNKWVGVRNALRRKRRSNE